LNPASVRCPGRISLAIVLSASVLGGSRARAEEPTPSAPNACQLVERQLSDTRAELGNATHELEAARDQAADASALKAALERAESELADKSSAVASCQNDQKNLCAAAETFSHDLGTGHVNSAGLSQCISPEDRRALVEELSGWSNASTTLGQLGAFASGDSDAAPGLGPISGSKLEKLLGRLFAQGNGTPLLYRRLLVEAMRAVAPRSWTAIKTKPGADRWFASHDPLDESIVAEVHASATAAPSAGGSLDLSASLALVSAYQLLAHCAGPLPAHDCQRADQVRQMLESSGPLIARRRVQDVWATPCSSVTESVPKDWLRDLPPARASEAQTSSVAQAIEAKLFTCFLRSSTIDESFSVWLPSKLPAPTLATARTLERLLKLEGSWQPGSSLDRCAQAVHALQTIAAPAECSLQPARLEKLDAWLQEEAPPDEGGRFDVTVCRRLARALWEGESATLPNSFATPPSVEDTVQLVQGAPETAMSELRSLCDARVGPRDAFAVSVRELGGVARKFGENPTLGPWKLDATTLEPREKPSAARGETMLAWLESLTHREAACSLLGFDDARCRECRSAPNGSLYDCTLMRDVEDSWTRRTRKLLFWSLLGATLGLILLWGMRLRRALRRHSGWRARASSRFDRLELELKPDRLRYLLPSRLGHLEVALPHSPAWGRWGGHAAIVRAEGAILHERDVNRAGSIARSLKSALALVVHDDLAAPDLGAVRAVLEWDARAGSTAVHVLPISWSRLNWSRDATDLLELAEDSSLRNNPFELRGRITSSSQFFNRERLVSGLLAGAQSGRFTVVTGLRRFGKSSLVLEVARRLPGPSAYVDLAGFHHEIHSSRDPADAADAILRFLCLKLTESAQTRWPKADVKLAVPSGPMDAAALTVWFRGFASAVTYAEPGRAAPVLLILDEIEQAIGAAAQLNHAIDVFAIVVGRLRNSLPGPSHEGGPRIGLLFCSALHPLLWSPLATLAHQSLVGSFEYVSVPSLPEDTAISMMQGLGARHGVRFSEPALKLLVRESQGVPLLLRRMGSVVLELYDPERARQGALGAVEIGIEGVRAALEREVTKGSPLRVWVESEIAEANTPAGDVLRFLAKQESGSARKLRAIAARAFSKQFDLTGVALALAPEETTRRAEEGAGVVLRILGDSGLLKAHGDPTEPEAYELPDGVIRRILAGESAEARPSAPREISA
jgi:hypothetical protein